MDRAQLDKLRELGAPLTALTKPLSLVRTKSGKVWHFPPSGYYSCTHARRATKDGHKTVKTMLEIIEEGIALCDKSGCILRGVTRSGLDTLRDLAYCAETYHAALRAADWLRAAQVINRMHRLADTSRSARVSDDQVLDHWDQAVISLGDWIAELTETWSDPVTAGLARYRTQVMRAAAAPEVPLDASCGLPWPYARAAHQAWIDATTSVSPDEKVLANVRATTTRLADEISDVFAMVTDEALVAAVDRWNASADRVGAKSLSGGRWTVLGPIQEAGSYGASGYRHWRVLAALVFPTVTANGNQASLVPELFVNRILDGDVEQIINPPRWGTSPSRYDITVIETNDVERFEEVASVALRLWDRYRGGELRSAQAAWTAAWVIIGDEDGSDTSTGETHSPAEGVDDTPIGQLALAV